MGPSNQKVPLSTPRSLMSHPHMLMIILITLRLVACLGISKDIERLQMLFIQAVLILQLQHIIPIITK